MCVQDSWREISSHLFSKFQYLLFEEIEALFAVRWGIIQTLSGVLEVQGQEGGSFKTSCSPPRVWLWLWRCFIVYCILYIAYCILHIVYCILYIAYCILYVYCILYIHGLFLRGAFSIPHRGDAKINSPVQMRKEVWITRSFFLLNHLIGNPPPLPNQCNLFSSSFKIRCFLIF